MKKWIAFGVLIILFLAYSTRNYFGQPDGSTVRSREELLENILKGADWKIAKETKFKNHIISGMYSSDGKSGIVVFEPRDNGTYKMSSREWRENDEVVISGYSMDGTWYDLVWFHGGQTEYAEIIYSFDGEEQEPMVYDTRNMDVLVHEAPAKDYSMRVVYYDENGNAYE